MVQRLILKFLLIICAATAPAYGMEPGDTITGKALDEVTVTGNSARQRVAAPRIGVERIELSRMVDVPSFGGENDIIRAIALLPGVRTEGEGAGGFEVRGGNASQNLVTLDGITLYNPAHVMGIFSTFNDNALGSATLYKGPIPATFGGATSSVLETSLAPGDMERFHGLASIGILAAKAKIEGPIVKNKLSMAVTARRSYVDAFLKMVPEYRSTVMNFYDITAKVRYRPSASHLVDGSFFMSRDNMAIAKLMGMHWGNLGGSVNWLAKATDRVTFTTSAAATHFAPRMYIDIMDSSETMRTFIRNYSINERMRWTLTPSHALELGARSELLRVKSAEWETEGEREIRSLWENSLWIDYAGSFAGKIDVAAGVRLDASSALSAARFHDYSSAFGTPAQFDSKTYIDIEPRLNVKYNIDPNNSVKAGFGTAMQNLHAIRSNTTSFPFDRYALTSASVKPERSEQWSLGYAGMTPSGDYDWSAETYYRSIDNVYDFKDGRSSFSDIALESIILGGKGRSYGAEFMLRKNSGKLTGWVAYTISRTETRIPGVNDGRWYNATNDRRHDFSITAIYHLTQRWTLSGSWIYMSGQPLTAPDVKYEVSGMTCYYYSRRNGYMTPSTNRLDLSAKYTREGKRYTSEWAFGIYNAYCRYNPFVVYFTDDPSKPSGTKAVQQSMYGLVPSVSYTLKF